MSLSNKINIVYFPRLSPHLICLALQISNELGVLLLEEHSRLVQLNFDPGETLQTQPDIIITRPCSPCLVLSPDLDVSLHQLGLPHGLAQLQSLNTGKTFSLDIL